MADLPPEIIEQICEHLTDLNDLAALAYTCHYFRSVVRPFLWRNYNFNINADCTIPDRDIEEAEFALSVPEVTRCVRGVCLDCSELALVDEEGEVSNEGTDLDGLPRIIREMLEKVPLENFSYIGPMDSGVFRAFRDQDDGGEGEPVDADDDDLWSIEGHSQAMIRRRRQIYRMELELLEVLSQITSATLMELRGLQLGPSRTLTKTRPFLNAVPYQLETLSIVDSNPLIYALVDRFPKLSRLYLYGCDSSTKFCFRSWADNLGFWTRITQLRFNGYAPTDFEDLIQLATKYISNEPDGSTLSIGKTECGLTHLCLYMYDMSATSIFELLEALQPRRVEVFEAWAIKIGDTEGNFGAHLARLMPNLSKLVITNVDIGAFDLNGFARSFSAFSCLREIHALLWAWDTWDHQRFVTRKNVGAFLLLLAQHCPTLKIIRAHDKFHDNGWWKVVRDDNVEPGVETKGGIVIVSDEDADRERVEHWERCGGREEGEKRFEIRWDVEGYETQELEDLDELERLAESGWVEAEAEKQGDADEEEEGDPVEDPVEDQSDGAEGADNAGGQDGGDN